MNIHEVIAQHKNKIEITQWAIIAGVSSLVYSEYIRRIKQKAVPTRIIMIPTIKSVMDLIKPDGQFMKLLSESLIDRMSQNPIFQKYLDSPELVLFQSENKGIMQELLDMYIIPNIFKSIPNTIFMKFGLGDEGQQLIRESREIDLFERQPISQGQMQFIIDETVLQLLILMPTIEKNIDIPEDNTKILITEEEILTIANENAICPIHFNSSIIENGSVNDLLQFVTSTFITDHSMQDLAKKNNKPIKYSIQTSVFNQVGIVTLH